MIITTKCAHCGAQIVFEDGQEAVICKYCESVNAIPEETVLSESSSENMPILREVFPEVSYAANHQISSLNSQGGHIWITKNELYFKPHKFNVGDLSQRYIRIQDICGYSKGAFTALSILTKKGYEMKLAVWNKDEIINALESRRQAYYRSKNKSIPPLTTGSSCIDHSEAIEANNMSNSGCMLVIIVTLGIFSLFVFSYFA